MLKDSNDALCYKKNRTSEFEVMSACDSTLSLAWELTRTRLIGEESPTLTAEEIRQMTALGLE